MLIFSQFSLLHGPPFLDFWLTPLGSNFNCDNAFLYLLLSPLGHVCFFASGAKN